MTSRTDEAEAHARPAGDKLAALAIQPNLWKDLRTFGWMIHPCEAAFP